MSRELTVSLAPLSAKPTGIAVIYVAEGKTPADAAGALWAETGLDWAKLSDLAAFKGKPGQEVDVLAPANLAADRLLVLGAGKAGEGTAPLTAWADRGGALMARLAARKATQVSVIVEGADVTPEAIAELAAGLHLRHYKFDKYKSGRKGDDAEPKPLAVTLHVAEPAAAEKALAERLAVVAGTLLARDLVNEPANVLGTLEFADRASKLSALGVQIQILDEKAMADLGMNSLLAVSKGSVRPPRLVIMRWNGTDPTAQPVAFIGKGVVFDTGGISIKPAANMEDMKGDMGGAAAVTGLMHALAARKARVNAVGIIGLVENMPDGNATRPGDIVTAMSGTTIEVINTDAEGRLVLADALWYAQDRFKPKFMINLATLTGAILVALGQDHAGLFSNNDALSQNLLAAGLASNEKLWRMPMGPAYDKMIESRFADIKNSAGRHAGSITAAHFLSRFVNDVPWAHLDIAGTAMAAPSSDINTSWGSGFGVALLNRLVKDYYEG